LSSVMKTYGLNAKDATTAQAMLNGIVGAGDMRFQDLNNALSTGLLPAAQNFGVSLQGVGSALDFMTDRGTPAAVAATRIRMAISLMGAPSEKAAKELGALGLSSGTIQSSVSGMGAALQAAGLRTTDLSADLHKPDGIVVALTDLKTHLEGAGLSATTQAALISSAFGGGKSGAGIEQMYQNIGGLQQKFDMLTKTGSLSKFDDAWTKTTQTLNYQIGAIKADIDAWAVRLGTVLIPVVEDLLKWILDGTKWLGQHKVALEILAGIVGGIAVASIIALTVAMGVWVAGMLAASVTIAGVEIALGPVMLILAAVGIAAVLLATHWKLVWGIVKDVVKDAWGYIDGAFNDAKSFIVGIWNQISDFIVNTWHSIYNAIGGSLDTIKDLITTTFDVISGIFTTVLGGIVTFFQLQWTIMQTAVKVAWDIIKPIISTALELIAGIFKIYVGTWLTIMKGVWDAIKLLVRTAITVVKDVINATMDILTGQWGKAWDAVSNLLSTVWSTIQQLISIALSTIVTTIVNAVKGFGTLLYNAGKDLIAGLINGIKHAAGAVGKAVTDVGKDALHSVTSFFHIGSPSKLMADQGVYLMQGLAQGISQSSNIVTGAITQVNKAVTAQSSSMTLGPSPAGVSGVSGTAGAAGGLVYNPQYNLTLAPGSSGSGSTGNSGDNAALISQMQTLLQQHDQELLSMLKTNGIL
jgi:phage-related protein